MNEQVLITELLESMYAELPEEKIKKLNETDKRVFIDFVLLN